MPTTFVHFETLRERVASHPDTPVFKLPKAGAAGHEWVDVSFTQFQADIERMARLWLVKFSAQKIPVRSVVGIWLRGFTYQDVVTIYAISRAGFIPQMFGFELPNTRIIFELLAKYDGRAVIHDPAKTSLLFESKTTIPCYVAVDYASVSDGVVGGLPLPDLPEAHDDDYTFIYHSSGSVSGMPKVVPKTNRWMSSVEHKSGPAFSAGDYKTQDVFVWIESFSHAMEICLFQSILHRAGCLVQPSRIDFDSHELATRIRKAGVNRITQFTGVLRLHLEDARRGDVEPDLLALLKGARQTNFGCTECGKLLTSVIGDRRLEMLPTISYKFEPVSPTSIDINGFDRLLELWILPDSSDLPVPALCTTDGGWRSGDLFEEVGPGKYLFRGRDDDWIKSQWSERLDTKAIENNVYTTCSDIVANCVVVGNGRPFPALLVEPRCADSIRSEELALDLKHEILKRTSDFNSLRYPHERIQDAGMIKVVPVKSLPRTAAKGNIRRRAVEQDFADDLEEMYASIPVCEVYSSVLSVPSGEEVNMTDKLSGDSSREPTAHQVAVAA